MPKRNYVSKLPQEPKSPLNLQSMPKVEYTGIGTLSRDQVKIFEVNPTGLLQKFSAPLPRSIYAANDLWYATINRYPDKKFAICEWREDPDKPGKFKYLLICVHDAAHSNK